MTYFFKEFTFIALKFILLTVNCEMENLSLYIEILGTLFGVAYVILAAKKNIWCWIAGIISSVLSVYLFWVYSNLYAEAILHMYFVIAGIVGWIQWSNPKTDRPFIIKVDLATHLFFLVIGTVLSFLLYFLISFIFPDAAKPLIDSFTTVFSFLATWITIRKWISSWIYWIVIDSISVGLYWSRDLNIYAFLMVFYTFLAIYGYYSWKKSEIKTVRFNKILKGSQIIA